MLPDTAQSFSRNLIHSRVNPVPKLEEEEEEGEGGYDENLK